MRPPGRLPGDDRPPVPADLSDPVAYRHHVGVEMQRSFELARRYRRLGDRCAWLSIVLAFASSVLGFTTALVDNAWLGIGPGVLGAAGGSVAAVVKRGRFDSLAEANERLCAELEHEVRHFDARAGAYVVPDGGAAGDDGARRAFQLFVERCEDASARANTSTHQTGS